MSDMYMNLLLLLCFWSVSVNALPKTEPERVTVQEGDTAVLSCSITEKGLPPVIIWRKADSTNPLTVGAHVFVEDVRINVRTVVHTDKQNWDLMIQRAALSDKGIYLCEGSSREPRVLKLYSLQVTPKQGIPEISGMKLTGTEKVKQYDRIHLVCTATSALEAPDDIDWFVDGNKIMTQDRVTITKRQDFSTRSVISELEINQSRLDDSGDYVCRSSNFLVQSIAVHVFYSESSSMATTHVSATTTQDETGTGTTHDTLPSEEITKDMVMAARLEFYREQILTDRKRRQMMDIEKRFYETMITFLQQRDKENAQ